MSEAFETARNSNRFSTRMQAASSRFAGLSQGEFDDRGRGKKQMWERKESSLQSFGTNAWAQKADRKTPRLATTMMVSYGVTAVPDWTHSIGRLDLKEHHDQGGIWLGTRYSRSGEGKQHHPKPWRDPMADPRMARWRGNPPNARGQPDVRPASAFAASSQRGANQQDELDDLRSMLSNGRPSARSRRPISTQPTATPPVLQTPPEVKQDFAWAVQLVAPEVFPKAKPKEDLSWVVGPWAGRAEEGSGGRWIEAARSALGRPNPVPNLDLNQFTANSKASILARHKAYVRPSG